MKRQSLIAIGLIGIGALILIGAYFWYTGASTGQETQIAQDMGDIPYPQIKRVSLADAKAAYDLGTAVFIDVRDEFSYEQNHITNALSMPLDGFQQQVNELDPAKWYILYCT